MFDYAVPAAMDADARVGVRVRVRFAGRLLNGFIVARVASTDVDGTLRPIERVISPEVVLTAEVLALVEAVAARCAGTFFDVVRAAIPPRHARAESVQVEPCSATADDGSIDRTTWARYRHGAALLDRLVRGETHQVRAVWAAAPARPWADDVVAAVRAILARPTGGALIIVPDAWDAEQVRGRLSDVAPAVSVLTADLGPERRYREYCRILRGGARVVIGTRAAVYAPVRHLELIVVWDDGNDLLWEPHAPYWNARDVAALRSHLTDCALLVGSPARTAEAQQWCATGWAASLSATRAVTREAGPIVRALDPGDDARDAAASTARIPRTAWQVAKEGVRHGPVLIQVARSGYLPMLACMRCHAQARCPCGGPLRMRAGSSSAACTWCGSPAAWHCPECGSTRFRAQAVGAERTAEEFGRAFPGERIIWSTADQLMRTIGPQAAIVIATPGAEPVAEGGYAAVVILDARGQLMRTHLRAGEDAAARWFAAALLARPRAHLIVTADTAAWPVQALIRWDAPWLADRELADRAAAGLPPAVRAALLRGAPADVEAVAAAVRTPHRLLGPVDGRGILTVQRDHGADLARELRSITATRSAKAAAGQVTVVMDPRGFDA